MIVDIPQKQLRHVCLLRKHARMSVVKNDGAVTPWLCGNYGVSPP
jgi:hypothetical protein